MLMFVKNCPHIILLFEVDNPYHDVMAIGSSSHLSSLLNRLFSSNFV